MCLEPAEKDDEVVNFLMVNFFEKVLSRGKNKEEPLMIPLGSNPSEEVYSADELISELVQFEPSAESNIPVAVRQILQIAPVSRSAAIVKQDINSEERISELRYEVIQGESEHKPIKAISE
ncbi:hypothetical protein Tco_0964127 [Tanacetum coccineum]